MPKLQLLLRPLVMVSVAFLTVSITHRGAAQGLSVPSPTHSTVSPSLNIEPGGGMPFSVTVRDFNGFQIVNSTVMIDLCACPAVVLCPDPLGPGELVIDGCKILGVTGANGAHVFNLKGGGGCSPINVNIYADGVWLATRRVTSPDQNGDLSVDTADLAALDAKLGTGDLSGDLNADGAVTIADRVVLEMNLGHICPGPTPNRRSTWGDLKIRYR